MRDHTTLTLRFVEGLTPRNKDHFAWDSEVVGLQAYRWMGVGPPFRKIGGRVLYSAEEVDEWRMTQAAAETEKVSGSHGPA